MAASSFFKYEVFLSFRGVDTRQGFTWNLYQSLQNAGIFETFMDEMDIEAGEAINERLLKAIEDSRYCVVILSSGYADSKACLMELAAMFRLKKEIIPVFLYVEPSHVSNQSGPFEIAFSTHQKRSNSSSDVDEWRQAMTQVGKLKGFHLNNQSCKKEAEWIQEIVERVGGHSHNVWLPVADHPVGMDSGIKEVMKLLSIEDGGVKMVGIYGMGGVGKTTLAKEIRNRLQGSFGKAIYMECIKDKKDRLPTLQEEFISKAFKEGNLHIYNISEGIAEIKKRFSRTRLLVILDDVEHGDQLEALAGGCDWFGEGTRILITTRDKSLLDARRVDRQYEVHELNSIDSLRLFNWYAFNNEKPSEEYMEISQQVAQAAGGLPLALKVLGSSLIGQNDKRIWEEVVTRLRGLKYDDINERLRISYDGLDQEEQNIFLDVACFFIDKEKGRVLDILRGCFETPESSIDILLKKCLLKVDDHRNLCMHDLLRDMGRNIGSRTRLLAQQKLCDIWDGYTVRAEQKLCDVLDGYTGTHDEIEGIVCQKILEREKESLDVEAFTDMSKLRLLLLENIQLKGDFSKMPTSLRSLRWEHCPMKVLPDSFNIQKIGFLDLSMGNIIQVWSDSYMSNKKVFPNLKLLDLSECKGLVKLPDFSCFSKLEKLYLKNCSKLVSIPDSICGLANLVYLNISGCQLIKELPNEIGKLKKLIELYLHGTKIDALPHSVRSLKELEVLSLNGCEKLKMPASGEVKAELLDFVENLKRLRELSLCQYMLEKIPDQSLGKLTNLEELKVGGALRELPNTIDNLNKLCVLDLSCSSIEELPESIGTLTRLEHLNLSLCNTLRVLPSSIGNLRKLRELYLAYVPIGELPNSIQLLESLTMLNLKGCDKLETVLPLWELKSLRTLWVKSGSEVDGQQVGNLVKMSGKSPHSQECRMIEYFTSTSTMEVWIVSVTVGDQKRETCLFDANALGSNNRPWLGLIFPNDFVDFEYKCEDWSPNQGGTFNTGIPNLSCIRMIDLSNSDMEELAESIVHLPNLKKLILQHCKKLKCLPISFGCLTLLWYLNLWGCESLTALPESFGGMKNLRSLALGRSGIKELPNTMKSLSSLDYLNINRCVKLRGGLPLCDLKALRTLEFVVADDEEGEETNEEVPDDMVEMSGYSEQLQQFRRIRFIGCDDDIPNHMLRNKWELSIRMGDEQERVIEVWEQVYIVILFKWQWLKLIFPEDFDREQGVAAWPSLSKQLGQCLDPHTDALFVPPELTLCEIDIQSLPDTIGCLLGLRILRLRECKQLTCLPESIGYLIGLRILDLRGCTSLSTLPNSIGNLTRLEVLDLTDCKKLKCLPISFGCLTLLRILNLWRCESLTALPESIGGMKNLRSLALGRSGIKEFPNSMKSLSSLAYLTINAGVKLRGGVPLCDLEALRRLDFVVADDEDGEETNEEVPDDMVEMSGYSEQLQQFRRIRFIGCHDDIPGDDDIPGMDILLKNQWELSITMGDGPERVITVFEYVHLGAKMKWRWLKLIFPEDFDREQGVAAWPSLSKQLGRCLDPQNDVLRVPHVLTICEIDTQSLPDTIGCLHGLRILRLYDCKQLTCLPESIGYFIQLRILDLLRCTSLLTLPNSIGNLTRLEGLALTGCTSLKLLPNSIGNLKRLWFLSLMDSGIQVIPDSFPLLESLEGLNIIGCYRLQGRLPLWEMKCLELLVVGGDVDQKVEGDDEIGEGEFCEIPDGITHYSQQAKEYRRIHSNIQDEKLELSIWVDGSREREIELLVYPPCEGRKGQSWLRHIFPDDFTPQYDTRTRSEASASHSSPPDTSAASHSSIVSFNIWECFCPPRWW